MSRHSQVVVGKVTAVLRERLREVVGCLNGQIIAALDRALVVVHGLA